MISLSIGESVHMAKRRLGIETPIGAGFLAEDISGTLNYYDQRASEIVGYSRNDAVGMPSLMLLPTEQEMEGALELIAKRDELFRRVKQEGIAIHVENTPRMAIGRRLIRVNGIVFPYEAGLGVVSVAASVEIAYNH